MAKPDQSPPKQPCRAGGKVYITSVFQPFTTAGIKNMEKTKISIPEILLYLIAVENYYLDFFSFNSDFFPSNN